jgi:urea carboxylase
VFRKVLIANRGAIACRIQRTLRRMEIDSVAVYSDVDRSSPHVRQASESVCLGGARSYLDVDAVLAAAKATGAEAIHPGYGFLSENAAFAEACEQAGLAFIGPTPDQIRAFGLKHRSKEIAQANGVPLLPGTGLLNRWEDALQAGLPLMLKSTAGGGGIGMRLCRSESELAEAFEAVKRLGEASFRDGGLFAERFVEQARHIEVQIFGDGRGRVVALGERDCSAQRRNQKVIEETPAPGLTDDVRQSLAAAAIRLGESISYRNAGTVEFIYDNASAEFFFLEVNTRLQVEHGVTEEVTGVDLVEWMVRLAAGEDPIQPVAPKGASIQVRVYAEAPLAGFQPSSGTLAHVEWPSAEETRVDTWIESGSVVTPYYDPMLAKIIARGETRQEALSSLAQALMSTRLHGLETNLHYVRAVLDSETFREGKVTTAFLKTFAYAPRTIEVLEPGTQSTVQDWPGRLGYWDVGVPPSGPMDDLAFRLANEVVGNEPGTAAFEFTLIGPTLRFHHDATIALTGADMGLPRWEPIAVRAGETIRLKPVEGAGARAYMAVRGGIDVPDYLGSKSTFILGKFGGRALRAGDFLHFGEPSETASRPAACSNPPSYTNRWEIGVTYGPHGAPDFFTQSDIDTFFATDWRVHYNSDRTGVRLIGPKPEWARKDGGEAGLHPSNIHDNAYAVGTVDFTGDMPIILGPDGPSCGGFVCPATITAAERWKMGQLKAGDTVRFRRVNDEPAILRRESSAAVIVRADGDRNLLVEFGENKLDFELSMQAHSMRRQLLGEPGIIDLTPGIRSLQIHYNPAKISREDLFARIDASQSHPLSRVPSRIVHLPLSWDDPATRDAIQRYMQGVRADAPWCPWNIEFIRRINGLGSVDDVHRIVFEASWLTLALGDVYLGAPVATPVDPRHRLVTTKYNPARTWTPENAVGIGGAYMCVYGMEGPGGYQFVGRTTQMWNTHRTPRPWLLDFFDRIRFYPVTAQELLELRADPSFTPRIEDGEFDLTQHRAFLHSIEKEAKEFQHHRDHAFAEERARWGEYIAPALDDAPPPQADALPEGATAVRSPITASVWSIPVSQGQKIQAGERMLILEAMKMEVAVTAPLEGEVLELRCVPGALVHPGQVLAVVR